MLFIPKIVYVQYRDCLHKNGVPVEQFQEYVKWLRFYLDFCSRYVVVLDPAERLHLFQDKLREKGQNDGVRKQASHAVSIYHAMQRGRLRKKVPVWIYAPH